MMYHSGFLMPVMKMKVQNMIMKGCEISNPAILTLMVTRIDMADASEQIISVAVESFKIFSFCSAITKPISIKGRIPAKKLSRICQLAPVELT